MNARLRVISPHRESPFGTTVEVYGKAFAVIRVSAPGREGAAFYSHVQEAIGLPLVILHPDQDIELVEVVEADPPTQRTGSSARVLEFNVGMSIEPMSDASPCTEGDQTP